jgi:FkbM family methyltransferase
MTTPLLSLLKRKCATVGAILSHCDNWGQILRSRIRPGSYQGEVRLRTGVILKPRHSLDNSWGEIFEAAIADVYGLRTLPAPDVIWDVGANIGGFTCVAAHTFPQASVVAYEPDPGAIEAFQANVKANRLSNVTLVPHPVTGDGRQVDFSAKGGGGSSNIFSVGDGSQHAIPSVILNPPTGAGRLFIKLDCEGAEGEIIEWICARTADLPLSIRLVAEYHHWCPVPPEQCLQRLRKAGFSAGLFNRFDELYLKAERDPVLPRGAHAP